MSNMNHMPPMVSPENWTHDTGYDVYLRDPFSGTPLCGPSMDQDPNTPPAAFANHPELGAGYAIVRGRQNQYGGEAPMFAGILLTDSTSAAGLGELRDFRENMSSFDCVGYANKRGVLPGLNSQDDGPQTLRTTVGGDVIADDPYMDKLLGVASEFGMPVFNFDPPLDAFGRLADDVGRSLRQVENAVRAEAVMQDHEDSDAQLVVMDMVYSNTLQWHGIGRIGLSFAALMSEYGRYPNNVLLIVPAEHGDMTRKCEVSGIPQVREIFAADGLHENSVNYSYPHAMALGKIPGEALTD